MAAGTPALRFGLDPLIAEAKQRARRRRLVALVAAGLLVASGVAVEQAVSSGGGSTGTIPWLPTKPSVGPAHPPLAPACSASQLSVNLFLQGAAGNLAGPIAIVNRSSRPCALTGRPRLSFAGAPSWHVARMSQRDVIPFDPLAPPLGSLRALRPGEHVLAQLWVPTICQGLPGASTTVHALLLTAPGGGTLRLSNRNTSMGFPHCSMPATSTAQVTGYTPYVPQGRPSSALPLKASILSGGPVTIKGKMLSQPSFVSHPGAWLSYTLVLTNTSRRLFRFGRTCPAYTEDWGGFARAQAYVLNCRPVGSIAPGRSVPFAMRIRVPNLKLPVPAFGWTLAPHSYNAPSASASVELR